MKKMMFKGWAIVATRTDAPRFGESVVDRNSVSYTGVGFYEAQSLAETALKYFKDEKEAKVVPVILEMREVSKEEWETALPLASSP